MKRRYTIVDRNQVLITLNVLSHPATEACTARQQTATFLISKFLMLSSPSTANEMLSDVVVLNVFFVAASRMLSSIVILCRPAVADQIDG